MSPEDNKVTDDYSLAESQILEWDKLTGTTALASRQSPWPVFPSYCLAVSVKGIYRERLGLIKGLEGACKSS